MADLLDEVEVLAWEQFDRRPAKLPLDLWLIQLLHQVLKDWIKQEPRHHAELSERAEDVLPEDVPQVDDQEWWQWLLDDSEQPLTLEKAIPDRQRAEVDDAVADQELKERMLSLLSELPELQRQAFMLNVLDDFDLNEIAGLQNRHEGEVRVDIQAARRTLREQLRGQTVRR
jgi:RNA polymerase sigma factor (sigma-70 family)